MDTYNIYITQADLPYVIEAIGLRAVTIQESIRSQVKILEEQHRRQIEDQQRRKAEEERRAAMPDPFEQTPTFQELIEVSKAQVEHAKAVEKQPSRKQKRATLMRVLKGKGAADLSTAEIARRAGVSYVTAMKARKAFAPKKGRK